VQVAKFPAQRLFGGQALIAIADKAAYLMAETAPSESKQ